MRKIISLIVLAASVACLALAGAAQGYTCKSPAHEPHGGPVYPLTLRTFVSEEELYLVADNDPVGCANLLVEDPEGELGSRGLRWFPHGMGGLTPEIPFGTFVCYELEQTEAEPVRWSNRLCVWPLEHERL